MKYVYIPIEISARELDAKLLLASELVAKNVGVIIGKKKQLIDYMEVAKPGVFLSIWGAHKNFKGLYQSLSDRGFRVAVIDEEGLITISDDHYLENSVDLDTISNVSIFFCWGKKQKTLLENYAAADNHTKTRFVESGNIRFDLLRPDFKNLFKSEERLIKEKYPDCLLVVSSFGFARHFDGHQVYFDNLIKSGVIWNEKLYNSFENYLRFQMNNAGAFVELMTQLCKEFPEKQIVYRPHPSERLNDLNYLSDKFSNFFIDQNFSIIPWLRSVSFTIFNYCTTGPEAQVLGCANIAYRPFTDETIENDIPYRNTVVFESGELLVDYIRQMSFNQHIEKAKNKLQFDQEISCLGNDWAVKNIANELFSLFDYMPAGRRASLFAKCCAFLKNRLSRETPYVMHKYGQVDTDVLNRILDRLPNFGAAELEAVEIGRQIYIIGKKEN